jgi:hypothetical protein
MRIGMPAKKFTIALLLFLAAPIMAEEMAATLNENLTLGQPLVVDNVTVWPVFSTKPQAPIGDYVTLTQAQEKGVAVIHETGAATGNAQNAANNNDNAQQPIQEANGAVNASGTVNELVIDNKGDKAILVLAGTLVKGGKQDRQIGQDFIIPAGKSVPVGAFCVEHGRWTADRDGKNTNGNFEAQKCLANIEVRSSAQYKNDQQEVWNKVAISNSSANKSPSTGTLLATVEDDDKEAATRREKLRKAITERFGKYKDDEQAPVGLAYAVDGKMREIRSFAHPKVFGLYTETLVNTVVLEGDLSQREALAKKQEIYTKAADVNLARELVKAAESVKEEQVQTKAGNDNGYRKDDKVWNSNVYLKNSENRKAAAPVSQSWQTAH